MALFFENSIRKILVWLQIGPHYLELGYTVVATLALIVFIFLLNLFLRKIVIVVLKTLIQKRQPSWGAALLESRFFHRIFNFLPLVFLHFVWKELFPSYPTYTAVVMKIIAALMVVLGMASVFAVVATLQLLYDKLPTAKEHTIKSFIQVIKIVLYIVGFLFLLSVILDQSPLYILGGMSALAAVLMLVFKDSILGFVAGIQLAVNRMVKIGDWIVVPSQNADGIVVDLTLNTVKVENWDKTIAHFPSYSLVSDSFVNWRGMYESGGRRIKRSITIDIGSIKFCTPTLLNKLKKIQILKPYFLEKEKAIRAHNRKRGYSPRDVLNARTQTNFGIFRAYVYAYLRNHPQINQEMTLAVRQLQSTATGVPLEIYAFSSEQSMVAYEAVQDDIFDHLFTVMRAFELRCFQHANGIVTG